MRSQMNKAMDSYKPGKTSFMQKISKSSDAPLKNSVASWVKDKNDSCYICNEFKEMYERYLDTFFVMYKKDPDFVNKFKNSKGFCMTHFGDICEAAETRLNDKQKEEFFAILFPMMKENMNRLQEDVNWLIEKYDYRNKDADWKNSKDAIQRGMQMLKGGYPADPVYQQKK